MGDRPATNYPSVNGVYPSCCVARQSEAQPAKGCRESLWRPSPEGVESTFQGVCLRIYDSMPRASRPSFGQVKTSKTVSVEPRLEACPHHGGEALILRWIAT